MSINSHYLNEPIKISNSEVSSEEIHPTDQVFSRTLNVNGKNFKIKLIVMENVSFDNISKIFDDCKEDIARSMLSFCYTKHGKLKHYTGTIYIRMNDSSFDIIKKNKKGIEVRKTYTKLDIDEKIRKRIENFGLNLQS